MCFLEAAVLGIRTLYSVKFLAMEQVSGPKPPARSDLSNSYLVDKALEFRGRQDEAG